MNDAPSRLTAALGERYRIDRELGGGGMSRVYLAHDIALDRAVVLKVLSPDLAGEMSAERFMREIRLAASLQQANIVPLLSTDVAADMPYYVMPYVDGQSLRHRLQSGTPIPLTEAVGILRDVARALGYAHARGVVHRDIKPDNILLSHGTAMVADFGIAKAIRAARTGAHPSPTSSADDAVTLTRVGSSLGTPAYMAPEQITGSESVDQRADLYAWGCLAFELLTGAPPFTGTVQRVLAAHLAESPSALTTLRHDAPAGLARVVMQCLAKDPAQRPADAAAVLAALEETTTSERPAVSGRARMVWVATALLAVSAVAWWQLGRAPTSASGRETKADAAAATRASVAVLPFTEIGGSDSAYFGDGIAETLISALASVPELDVAARTSAFSFRGKNEDVREIARQLGVATVLEGSVQRAGDRLRITAQLVKAGDGVSLWSQTFDKTAADIFAVQDEVAQAVIGALRGKVIAANQRTTTSTRDLAAYELYLQARALAARRGTRDLIEAIGLYRQAIARDSLYAQAWAGLSEAYILRAFYSDVPPVETFAAARSAVNRALAIDSLLPEGVLNLGYLKLVQDWRAHEADSIVRRAITLAPGNATAHKWFYDIRYVYGDSAGAREAIRRAFQIDPRSAVIRANMHQITILAGDTTEAARWADSVRQIDPDQTLFQRDRSLRAAMAGDSTTFFDAQTRLERRVDNFGAPLAELRSAWQVGGARAAALRQVATFTRAQRWLDVARWHQVTGDRDAMFAALAEVRKRHDAFAAFLGEFWLVSNDPRWAAHRAAMGLPCGCRADATAKTDGTVRD
ncbi:MAG: protein kinase [Gemmatimonadaceae bacterium]|nr:protein kinase [Gemmatimonadaceae bacterium]